MSLASDYARRFAEWARNRRREMTAVYRCSICGSSEGELVEHDGKFYCAAHPPCILPPATDAREIYRENLRKMWFGIKP